MSKRYVIRDLAVLEGPWRDIKEEKQNELAAGGLMVMRGCSRTTILGNKEDIDRVRSEFEGKLDYLEGANAYGRLLQVVSGQLSKTPGETQIVRQFRNSWEKFKLQSPDKCSKLSYLYDSLIADNSLIRNRVTHGLKPAFFESTAAYMAEHNQGDTILIVCGAEKGDTKLNETTHNLARQLANHNPYGIKRLLITHPDPHIANRMVGQLRRLGLSLDIELVNFDEFFDGSIKPFDQNKIFSVQSMYVTLPMGQYPEADDKMIKTWAQREVYSGKLIHLGGAKKQDRITCGAWKDSDFFNTIMPEDITAQQNLDKRKNAELVAQGCTAAINCGLSRINGKNPVGSLVTLSPQDYTHRAGLQESSRQIRRYEGI